MFTITIADPLHALALVLYVVIAILVSYIVDQAARRTRAARRSAAESELLATVAGSIVRGESAVPALVSRAREAFGMTGVRLWLSTARSSPPTASRCPTITPVFPVGPRTLRARHSSCMAANSTRVSAACSKWSIAQLGAALEHSDLTQSAREADVLASTDQVRSALLSAVSHDLRRPLAAAMASIGGLRAAGGTLTAEVVPSCLRRPTRACRHCRPLSPICST